MFNKVILIGRTTSDVELKYTPTNVAVAQVTLAVNRSFKNANGDREADFVRLVIWSKPQNFLPNGLKKDIWFKLRESYELALTMMTMANVSMLLRLWFNRLTT